MSNAEAASKGSKRKAGDAAGGAAKRARRLAEEPAEPETREWDLARAEERPGGIAFNPQAIDAKEATRIFAELRKLPFEHLPVRGQRFRRGKVMFVDLDAASGTGSLYRFPYGNDASQKVKYADLKTAPKDVLALRDRFAAGANNVIVSLYPDGKAGISPHSDNRAVGYADLVPGKPIVDLVFMENPGQVRPFTYQLDAAADGKAVAAPPSPVWSVPAGHGSMLTMSDEANRAGKHAVPTVGRRVCKGARISIVFRWIQSRFDVATGKLAS